LQISARYLINFTRNCFALALAVVIAKLGDIAEQSAKSFHFCAIWSILHAPNPGIPIYLDCQHICI